MVDVIECCVFTETTLKLSTIVKLSLSNCNLKVENKLDNLCYLKILKFKNTSFEIQGKKEESLKTLKQMLNSTMSNLESLSLELSYSPLLEEYLDFIRNGFPLLKTLKLCFSSQMTLGELVSFSRLHQALSKPHIFPELVLKV